MTTTAPAGRKQTKSKGLCPGCGQWRNITGKRLMASHPSVRSTIKCSGVGRVPKDLSL